MINTTLKTDSVTMEFRKKQIEDDARQLSDFMMMELLSKLDMIKDGGEKSTLII